MASFNNCEFYYTGSEDCSFTNTLFESCFFHNAKFENVDFTGAVLKNCDLKRAQFEGVVLANVTLTEAVLGKNNFSSSRLTDIEIELKDGADTRMSECGFVSSVLERIKLKLFSEKDYRKVFRLIWTEAGEEKAVLLKERAYSHRESKYLLKKSWQKKA